MSYQIHSPLRFAALALVCLAAACEIPANNPFDPKTPVEDQAKAAIFGTVVLGEEGASVEGVKVSLLDSTRKPVRGADGQLLVAAVEGEGESGDFTLKGLSPGSYSLEFELDPRFAIPFVPEITLVAGEMRSVGVLNFSVTETGTGRIRGRAALVGAAGGTREIGVYRRREGRPAELVRRVTTDSNGNFSADQLPPGVYGVTAEAAGFFPDFSLGHELAESAPNALTQGEVVLEGENELKLYPATAVLIPDLPRQGSRYITNQDSAEIVLIPSVVDAWVTDMRLSADSAFVEEGEELAFEAFRQRASVKLPDAEGPITIYGQFRAKADDFEFTTDVFETELVRDVTPPSLISAELRGVVEAGGQLWAREDGATLTLQVQGNDLESGVAGFALHADSDNSLGAPDSLSFHDLTLPLGFVRIDHTFQLIEGQGLRKLGLWLQDHAGNTAGPHELQVVVDSEPPALAGALEILNAADGNLLESREVKLKIPVDPGCQGSGDEPEPGLCPVSFRYGIAPLSSTGEFEDFALDEDQSVSLNLAAGNGQVLGFEVLLRDEAGNSAKYSSELYTLRLLGELSGTVRVDGYPEGAGVHGGVSLQLKEQEAGELVASAVSESDGSYSLRHSADNSRRLPVGHYVLTASRNDLEPFEVQVEVRENRKVRLPSYRLSPARGYLRGRFARADDEGSQRAHGNIDVTALRKGVVVSRTVTLDDGSYSFPSPGLPVSAPGESYSILARASGYVSRQIDGLEVHRDQTTVVSPDPTNPDEPLPVLLDTLQGDFIFCASLSGPCEPTQYSNQDEVRIELLRSAGITHIRYQAGESFAEDENEETLAWHSYDPDAEFIVPIAASDDPDGEIEVFVQTRSAETPGSVLRAAVIRDTEAPEVLEFELEAGRDALEGFTSAKAVRAHFEADAGQGTVAPLQSAFIAFASTPPSEVPESAVTCSFDVPCDLQLPPNAQGEVEEKTYSAFLFACDRAGNCSTPPAEARITYDTTPPQVDNGLVLAPSADWIRQVGGQYHSRLERIDVQLDVGSAKTASNSPVLDPAGESVPEVVAWRFSSREDLRGASWQSSGDLQANASLSFRALELIGEDGLHTVYAQFRDAAGNVSSMSPNPHSFQVVLDRQPPAVSFKVNEGREWTKSRRVLLDVQTASGDVGPAREVLLSLDGLFQNPEHRTLPLTGDDRFFDLPDSDGSHTLHARFVDAAGNHSERSARVTLDRSAPTLLSLSCAACKLDPASGELHTNSRQVLVDVVASDNSGVIASLYSKVGNAPEVRSDYGAPVQINLPDEDGLHQVEVRVEDPAGNSSAAKSLSLVLDRSPPQLNLSLNEGAEYTQSASVVVRLVSEDDSLLSGLRLSNSGTFSGPVQAFASQLPWTLANPNEDGSRTVHAEVQDLAGNISTLSADIILDSHAPSTPQLSVSPQPVGESQALSAPQLVLNIESSDGSRPLEDVAVRISGDLAQSSGNTGWLLAGSGGLSFSQGSFKWNGALSGGDGSKNISVQLRDAAGNQSEVSTLRLLLRQKAPAGGSITLSHSPYTSSENSAVSLSARDASEVKLTGNLASVDGLPGNVGVWLPFTASLPVSFSSGDGLKTVQATFRNEAHQESTPVSTSTTLDTTAPSVSLSLQGSTAQGQPSSQLSASRNIQLQIDASDAGSGVEQVRVARSESELESTPWSPYSALVPWTLGEGDGNKTLFVEVRDRAGNSATESQSILLDTTSPARPVIEVVEPEELGSGNALATRNIKLKIQSSDATGSLVDGTLQVQGDIVGEAGSSSTPWLSAGEGGLSLEGSDFFWEGELDGGDGTKIVSVSIRDAAGNESAVGTVRLSLQESPPQNTSASLSATDYTSSRLLSLSANASGASELRIGGDLSSVDGSSAQVDTWQPFRSSTPVELSTGDGQKSVSVKFRNEAGQESSPILLLVVLDTTAPQGTVEITGPVDRGETSTTLTSSRSVTLSLEGSDQGSGLESMRVAHNEAGLEAAAWVSFVPSLAWTLPLGDGTQSVFVQLRDSIGNTSAALSASTVLDTTRPTTPRFAQRPAITSNPEVTLELDTPSTDAHSGPVRYEWRLPGSENWAEVILPQTLSVQPNQSQSYRLRAVDGAGNVSEEDLLSFTHDDIAPPPPTVVTPSRFVPARNTSVTLTGGESDLHFEHYERCTISVEDDEECLESELCTFESTSSTFVLSLAANTYTCVMARSMDQAGNASEVSRVSILSDTQRPVPPVIGPLVTRDDIKVQASEVEVTIMEPGYELPDSPKHWSTPWHNVAYLEIGTNGIFSPLCPESQKDGRWAPCDPEAEGGRCTDPRLRCVDYKDPEETCPPPPEPDPNCDDGGTVAAVSPGSGVGASPASATPQSNCAPPPPCPGHEILGFALPITSGQTTTLSARAVDLAGNVGDAVSVEVTSTETQEQAISDPGTPKNIQLFASTVAYDLESRLNDAIPQILELNENRDLSTPLQKCDVLEDSDSPAPLSLGSQGLAYGLQRGITAELWLRRRGEDQKFCTDDDDAVLLHSESSFGSGAIRNLSLQGDTVAWTSRSTTTCAKVNTLHAGPDGIFGTEDDAPLSLNAFVQTRQTADDAIQHAGRVFLLNDGGCLSEAQSTYEPQAWSVVHLDEAEPDNTWNFNLSETGLRPVLSPDGRFIVYGNDSHGRNITIREHGPDGRFGTTDDRLTTRELSPNPQMKIERLYTDGLRVVGTARDTSDDVVYLFTWSPGLDGVYQEADAPRNDDTFSVFAPSASRRYDLSLSKGLLAFSQHNRLKAMDLAQMRWEATDRGYIGAPAITPYGLAYHREGSLTDPRGLFFKQRSGDRYAAQDDWVVINASRKMVNSNSDFIYVEKHNNSNSFNLVLRSTQGNQAFTEADTVQILHNSTFGGMNQLRLPGAAGDGKAMILEGNSRSPIILEPGENGLHDSTWASAPAGHALFYETSDVGISANYAVWIGRLRVVWVWHAGPDGVFENLAGGDDLPPQTLKEAPVFTNEYRAEELAHSGDRIAMRSDFWDYIRVVSAGPDGVFNEGEDPHVDVPVPVTGVCPERCWLQLEGDHMAWIGSDPETGFEQVYLHDLRTRQTLRITSHPSEKRELELSENGRLAWIDALFPTPTVFTFVP